MRDGSAGCRMGRGLSSLSARGAGRTEVLQCQQGTLISSCRVRFSRGGYCAQVCLGTKAGFLDGMLSACRLQSAARGLAIRSCLGIGVTRCGRRRSRRRTRAWLSAARRRRRRRPSLILCRLCRLRLRCRARSSLPSWCKCCLPRWRA